MEGHGRTAGVGETTGSRSGAPCPSHQNSNAEWWPWRVKNLWEIAQKISIRNNTVTNGTKRWRDMAELPAKDRLQDLSRPGAPDKFMPEAGIDIVVLGDHDCRHNPDFYKTIQNVRHPKKPRHQCRQRQPVQFFSHFPIPTVMPQFIQPNVR